jgi:hypothetical protein
MHLLFCSKSLSSLHLSDLDLMPSSTLILALILILTLNLTLTSNTDPDLDLDPDSDPNHDPECGIRLSLTKLFPSF